MTRARKRKRASVARSSVLQKANAHDVQASGNVGANEIPRLNDDSESVSESAALREELKQLALVLDLKPKRRPRTLKVETVPEYRSAFTLRQLASAAAHVVVAIGFVVVMSQFRPTPVPTLPDDLVGGWTTTNPAYAGSEIGFVDAEFSMRLSPDGELLRYVITKFSTRARGDTSEINMTYETETGPVELHARLVSGARPQLLFDRPANLVWEHPTR